MKHRFGGIQNTGAGGGGGGGGGEEEGVGSNIFQPPHQTGDQFGVVPVMTLRTAISLDTTLESTRSCTGN